MMHHTVLNWLVAASLVSSIFAAYASFSFVERVGCAKNSGRAFAWIFGGALAMGLGIWTMHYLGMIAVMPEEKLLYHVPTVLLSLTMAVAASAIALIVISRRSLSWPQVSVGSILMAAGIGGMHYTGMHAMRSTAVHDYNPALVTLSLFVAVFCSWLALWIAFHVKQESTHRESRRVGGAIVMGLGIAAMHYVAMAACHMQAGDRHFSTAHTMRVTHLGLIAVVLTTALILIGALTTAILDRSNSERVQHTNDELCKIRAELLHSERALREANHRLTELSIRDALTGIHNRRHFDTMLETEWRRANRAHTPVSVLLIDVDHFKRFNDKYGHPAGDACLKAVADTLAASLRRSGDFVARYGGEEFAIILPETDETGAMALAERIRDSIANLEAVADTGELLSPITISIGTSSNESSHVTGANALIATADQQLYRAKAEGRNRVRGTLPIQSDLYRGIKLIAEADRLSA